MSGEAGKGDKRRPTLISQKQFEENWKNTFENNKDIKPPLDNEGVVNYISRKVRKDKS